MFLIFLFIFLLPFILFWIEVKVFPSPYLVEEIGKAFVILLILHQEKKIRSSLKTLVFLLLFWFILVENFFYASPLNEYIYFVLRFLITGSFHFITGFIFYFSARKSGILGIIAIVANIFLHFVFNKFLG